MTSNYKECPNDKIDDLKFDYSIKNWKYIGIITILPCELND